MYCVDLHDIAFNVQSEILIFYRLKYPGLVLQLVNYVVSTWVLLQKLFGSWNVSESRRTSYVSLFTNSFLTNYQRSRHFFLMNTCIFGVKLLHIYLFLTAFFWVYFSTILGVINFIDFEDAPKPI